MVGSKAVGSTIRGGTQIVIIYRRAAQARNSPRILLREEKHIRGMLYLGFLLNVLNGSMVLAGHRPPRIAVQVGIHTVTILRFYGNGRPITPVAAHSPCNIFERATKVNIFLLQVGPKHAGKVGPAVKILARIVPSTASTTIIVEPCEGVWKVIVIIRDVHLSRQAILTHVGPTENYPRLLLHPCQYRHQYPHQYCYNGYHNEKLN